MSVRSTSVSKACFAYADCAGFRFATLGDIAPCKNNENLICGYGGIVSVRSTSVSKACFAKADCARFRFATLGKPLCIKI